MVRNFTVKIIGTAGMTNIGHASIDSNMSDESIVGALIDSKILHKDCSLKHVEIVGEGSELYVKNNITGRQMFQLTL